MLKKASFDVCIYDGSAPIWGSYFGYVPSWSAVAVSAGTSSFHGSACFDDGSCGKKRKRGLINGRLLKT